MQKLAEGRFWRLGQPRACLHFQRRTSEYHTPEQMCQGTCPKLKLLSQALQGACCVFHAIQTFGLIVMSLRENIKVLSQGPSSHHSKLQDLLRNHGKNVIKQLIAFLIYLPTLGFMALIDMDLTSCIKNLYLKKKNHIHCRNMHFFGGGEELEKGMTNVGPAHFHSPTSLQHSD